MTWSYPQLLALPASIYEELVAWMNEANGRHR